jgi:hypothetical protein
MRKTLALTVIGMLLLGGSADAEAKFSKSHRQAVDQLFKAMQLAQVFDELVRRQIDVQIKTNPALARYRGVFRKFMLKYMSWASLRDAMAKIYMRGFSVKELRALTRFYKTPVGRKAARVMPRLSAAGAEIGMRRVKQNMGELQRMIRAQQGK